MSTVSVSPEGNPQVVYVVIVKRRDYEYADVACSTAESAERQRDRLRAQGLTTRVDRLALLP